MSIYSQRNQFDDEVIQNGDAGFIGFETRRHPTQLEQGVARFLQNHRLDNNIATVRKGIDRITADDNSALTAFDLDSGLGTEVSIASITRSGSTATATLAATPLVPYANGDEVEILGATQTAYNSETLTSGTVISGVRYYITDFNAGDNFTNIGGTNVTGNVFTATGTTPTTWTNGSSLQRLIDITYISDTSFSYPVAGTPTTPATGTITASPVLGEDEQGVFASCLFSDVDTDTEYIALAKSDRVTLVNPNDTANPIDIEYTGTRTIDVEELTVDDDGHILQVGNGLVINRGTQKKALEWDGNIFNTGATNVSSITRSGTTATVTTVEAHQYSTADTVTISGASQGAYNGSFTITVLSVNTFTYTVSGAPATPATGTILAQRNPQFKPVSNTLITGFLSMPKAEFSEYHPFARLMMPVRVLEYTISALSANGNIATATFGFNHGLQVGDRIKISGANDIDYNGTFVIATATATTFAYVLTTIPATTTSGSYMKCTLEVRDQFIVSDIYDHHTYDPVNNLFRINRGTADGLVALKVWQNDKLIALYEKSIHIVAGISLPTLEESIVLKVTDEVGCLARRTVEIIGDSIVFLSDGGVSMLSMTPELNLRGQEIPLSRDIQDQFDRSNLNYEYIREAVAVYFENRYYIAVPAAGSTRNNIVYIYNFINGKWESKDTFGSANYIDNFVVCKKDGKDRLFATSIEGAIQLWEELEFDQLGSVPTNTQIPSRLITRRYTMSSSNIFKSNGFAPVEVKRFMRTSINIDVNNGDVMTVAATTENPDSTATIASYTFTSAEDHLKRPRINKRGTGCEIDIASTTGRPKIRSVAVEGTESQLSNKSFS